MADRRIMTKLGAIRLIYARCQWLLVIQIGQCRSYPAGR
jgi:hypothetical protein